MEKPIVSIIGRPNVGKSCLFNRIVGRRFAVVDDEAGVTRDRNYMPVSWDNLEFLVTDTGGMVPGAEDSITSEVNAQVRQAIGEATVVIFLVDVQTGQTDVDLLIAKLLRREKECRVILAANKAEAMDSVYDLGSLMALGLGEPMPVSALHGIGVGNLLDAVTQAIRASGAGARKQEPDPWADALRIAVLGRPNAGKSSLVNKLLRKNRMIVNDAPGTTRDAIDSHLMHEGTAVTLIDTAGLRKKSHVKNDIEYYSNLRALESIKRSHVCALMVDAAAGFGEQDLKIAQKVLDSRRGMVVCFNKWDIVEKDHKTFDHLVAETRRQFRELRFVPFVAVSALTGQRVQTVIEQAAHVHKRMSNKVPTRQFREDLHAWARRRPHPMVRSSSVRILGGKQLPASFPLFRVFCTNPSEALPSYERYLANNIHETHDFLGCPVVIEFAPPGRAPGGRGTTPPPRGSVPLHTGDQE